MQALLKACRENGHPVVHVTTAYQITDRDSPNSDMGTVAPQDPGRSR
jgi:hypothetical protein